MIFNFNKFVSINESKSNFNLGDYVFLTDDHDDISYIAPWEGSYGIITNKSVYDGDDIYLVKLLSEITEGIREIIDNERQNNINDSILHNINKDEIWVHVDYLTKYKSLDDLKTAAYIFKNKNDIQKYNL